MIPDTTQALIFDLDGTLADTMPAHYEAWHEVGPRHNLELSEDRFYALGGWPTEAIFRLLAEETGQALDVVALSEEKERIYRSRLHHVQPIEVVTTIVQQYHGKLPLAVATGAIREVCRQTLEHIGLSGMFNAIVTCEDVPRHKPEPDIFLEAARQLGIPPQHCVVFEDSSPGIEAARRAGMQAIDVRTFYTPRRVTPSDPS